MMDALSMLGVTGGPKQKFEYELLQVLLYAIEFDTSPDKLQVCFEQLRERADLIDYNAMRNFLTRCIEKPEEIFERRLHPGYQPRKDLPAEPFPPGRLSLDPIIRWQKAHSKHGYQEAASFTRSDIDISNQDLEEVKKVDLEEHILRRANPSSPKVSTTINQQDPNSQQVRTSDSEALAGSPASKVDDVVNTMQPHSFVRALYDYKPINEHELSLQQGDHIKVLSRLDEEWWDGVRMRNKKRGWFPGDYCIPIMKSNVNVVGASEDASTPQPRPKSKGVGYDNSLMPSSLRLKVRLPWKGDEIRLVLRPGIAVEELQSKIDTNLERYTSVLSLADGSVMLDYLYEDEFFTIQTDEDVQFVCSALRGQFQAKLSPGVTPEIVLFLHEP